MTKHQSVDDRVLRSLYQTSNVKIHHVDYDFISVISDTVNVGVGALTIIVINGTASK